MNHKQVEAFRAVMQTGSTSRAAELLHTSQPAVSQLIAAFEHSVKLTLFARLKGRLIPTPEAQVLAVEVERSYVGMEQISRRAAQLRCFDDSKLVVSAMPALGYSFLPSVIKAYHQNYPNVFISLQTRGSAFVKDMVVSNECDIGLAADEIDIRNVIAKRFYQMQAVCAIPPGHPLARKKIIRPCDLHGLAMVATNPEDSGRIAVEKVLAEEAVVPQVVAESPYAAGVCSLVLAGLGVAIVNPVATGSFIARGLVVRPFAVSVQFGCWLLRPDRPKSGPESAFIDALNTAWAASWGRVTPSAQLTEREIQEEILPALASTLA